MKRYFINLSALTLFVLTCSISFSQASSEKVFQVKGFSITSPRHTEVDRFVKFIDEELAPRGVNTLVVFVCDKDYN